MNTAHSASSSEYFLRVSGDVTPSMLDCVLTAAAGEPKQRFGCAGRCSTDGTCIGYKLSLEFGCRRCLVIRDSWNPTMDAGGSGEGSEDELLDFIIHSLYDRTCKWAQNVF